MSSERGGGREGGRGGEGRGGEGGEGRGGEGVSGTSSSYMYMYIHQPIANSRGN